MRGTAGVLAGAAGFCLLASGALADSNCTGWVDLSLPETITLSKVTAAPRANFVKNGTEQAGCPATGANCQRKGFVVTGLGE